jgi:acyl-CoA thioesterase FadM
MAEPTPKPASIVLRRRIEWVDTDAAGVYHWTSAFRLVESAEAALHTALGIADRTFGATPRVAIEADFQRPLRFNDRVDVELSVIAVGRSSIRYAFALHGPDGQACRGTLTACHVDRAGGRATPWPADVARLLAGVGAQAAPADR